MLIDKQNYLLLTSDITAGVVKVNLPDIACLIASVKFLLIILFHLKHIRVLFPPAVQLKYYNCELDPPKAKPTAKVLIL